ncbi:MAG: CoA pyrophosphatase [bacterium]|nr:CoA pyrophosphatase [bacterium]MDT8365566.1 CoA pyrophosphatase [bacterium]
MTKANVPDTISFMLRKIRDTLKDHQPHDLHQEANAAVLIPLFEYNGSIGLVLIHRSETKGLHRGQMGFPGGMAEPADGGDLLQTALRESEEELNLFPEDVQIIGELSQRQTIVSGLTVKPFVGIIPFPYNFSPDPVEVQSTHTAILSTLVNEVITGVNSFELPPPIYPVNGKPVWGLTAKIITELLEVIGEK